MKGKGKVVTFWLLGENCPDAAEGYGDGDGNGDESECSDQVASGSVLDNLAEMSFPTKVTFCVSDHDEEAHVAKSRIIFNNSSDGNEVICS